MEQILNSKIEEEINAKLAPTLKSIEKIGKNFTHNIEQIQKQLEPCINSMNELSKIDFKNMREQVIHHRREHLLKLGRDGWCIDLDMTVDKSLVEYQDYEAYFINYFESNLEKLAIFLKSKNPTREQIIHKAFEAHKNGDYELSIPVFLTQIDGVCFDYMQKSLFTKVKSTTYPTTSEYVNSLSDELKKTWFTPLAEESPIFYSKNKREKEQIDFTSQLNRHLILHGESTDYPTKINSLKAISFLNYITQLFSLVPTLCVGMHRTQKRS